MVLASEAFAQTRVGSQVRVFNNVPLVPSCFLILPHLFHVCNWHQAFSSFTPSINEPVSLSRFRHPGNANGAAASPTPPFPHSKFVLRHTQVPVNAQQGVAVGEISTCSSTTAATATVIAESSKSNCVTAFATEKGRTGCADCGTRDRNTAGNSSGGLFGTAVPTTKEAETSGGGSIIHGEEDERAP